MIECVVVGQSAVAAPCNCVLWSISWEENSNFGNITHGSRPEHRREGVRGRRRWPILKFFFFRASTTQGQRTKLLVEMVAPQGDVDGRHTYSSETVVHTRESSIKVFFMHINNAAVGGKSRVSCACVFSLPDHHFRLARTLPRSKEKK